MTCSIGNHVIPFWHNCDSRLRCHIFSLYLRCLNLNVSKLFQVAALAIALPRPCANQTFPNKALPKHAFDRILQITSIGYPPLHKDLSLYMGIHHIEHGRVYESVRIFDARRKQPTTRGTSTGGVWRHLPFLGGKGRYHMIWLFWPLSETFSLSSPFASLSTTSIMDSIFFFFFFDFLVSQSLIQSGTSAKISITESSACYNCSY